MRRRGPLRHLDKLADEDLMPLVARGEERAFELLYERHARPAYSLAHRILGDRDAAEDATQEGFLSLWRTEAPYEPGRGSVRSWIVGAVRNRAIDSLRRTAARPAAAGHDAEAQLERRAGVERTDDEAMRREVARELRGALDQLPGPQSQVIELAYFGGFSQSEIADALDLPLGTVKGRMRLGLERIRERRPEMAG